MPDTRSASAMVDRERQPELGPNSTVQKRGRNKKTTNKKTPVSVAPSQDLIGANTRADAEANAEIAKLKGASHAQIYAQIYANRLFLFF